LKTAPGTVTPSRELLGSTVRFQPLIVPLSAAQMNAAGPLLPSSLTAKPEPPLKTIPVGAPSRIFTMMPCLVPSPL
jgi:hypothetical protein